VTSAGLIYNFAGFDVSALGTEVILSDVDGVGTNANFNTPNGICVDPSTGDFLVAELFGCSIRRITPAGVVTTIAGSGACSSTAVPVTTSADALSVTLGAAPQGTGLGPAHIQADGAGGFLVGACASMPPLLFVLFPHSLSLSLSLHSSMCALL
jgi:hypothetical protein